MESRLRAGIAIYNAGEYHAAHDAWEQRWLELEPGSDDERLLHGLIQFTAVVYHAFDRNWAGATGLAGSAQEYLAPLPDSYRAVNVDAVRSYLAAFERDPELIERRPPLRLTYDGKSLTLSDLEFDATCVAGSVLATEYGYDEDLLDRAIEYAREAVAADETNPFVPLVFDFVREPESRGIIVSRMRDHADRRRTRQDDVSGLFDPE